MRNCTLHTHFQHQKLRLQPFVLLFNCNEEMSLLLSMFKNYTWIPDSKAPNLQKPYQQAPLSAVPSTFKLLSPSFKDDLVSLTWNSGENTSSFSYCPLSSRTLDGQEYQRKTFGLSFLNSHTLHSTPSRHLPTLKPIL